MEKAIFSHLTFSVYCQCGGELTGMKGDLHAPNSGGDSSYDPNSDCTWTIIAEPNNVIELQFYSMDIEYHAFCIYDYIEVRIKMKQQNQYFSTLLQRRKLMGNKKVQLGKLTKFKF